MNAPEDPSSGALSYSTSWRDSDLLPTMTKEKPAAPPPPELDLDERTLEIPIDDDGKTWSSIRLRPATAADLWDSPVGGADLKAQALITARRIEGLEEHRRGPFCRKLETRDFAMVTHLGQAIVTEYNRAQNGLREELEALDPTASFVLQLEDGFHGRKGAETGEIPLVRELTFRPLRGADLWNSPDGQLSTGDVASIGAGPCGYAVPFLKRLSPGDLGRVIGVVSAFLAPFQPTGETD